MSRKGFHAGPRYDPGEHAHAEAAVLLARIRDLAESGLTFVVVPH